MELRVLGLTPAKQCLTPVRYSASGSFRLSFLFCSFGAWDAAHSFFFKELIHSYI